MRSKKLISILLLLAFCLGFTGCSKDARECKKMGKAYINAAFDLDFDTMASYCADPEYVRLFEEHFENDPRRYTEYTDTISALLDHTTFRVDEIEETDGGIHITYLFTYPHTGRLQEACLEGASPSEAIESVSETLVGRIDLMFVRQGDQWVIVRNSEDTQMWDIRLYLRSVFDQARLLNHPEEIHHSDSEPLPAASVDT